MGYHLTGFFESQDGAGVEQNLAALTDPLSQIFPVVNGDFLRVSDRYRFISGAYVALDATVFPRARLSSEGIKKRLGGNGLSCAEISSTVKPGSPPVFNDWRAQPIECDPGESLELQTVNNPAAGAAQYGILFMSDGKITPVDPQGGFWTRWTAAASAKVASTWNARALTPDANLRVGYYDVLAMKHFVDAGNEVVSRLAFDGQVNKPGVLGQNAVTDKPYKAFEVPGQWGVLGRFHTNNPPVLEALPNAADNIADDVRLYVKPANGSG